MKDAPACICRLVDLVEEYEDAVATAPEPTADQPFFPNTIAMIDLVVRIIHMLEVLTDDFRGDLAQLEDDLTTPPPT